MNETSVISPASTGWFGHFGNAADILDAIRLGEAEIAVESVTYVIAVEHEGVLAERMKLLLQLICDGGLATAPGEPVNHSSAGFTSLSCARAVFVTSKAWR